jgi:protoporphyrinogen oxidase
MRLRIAVIGGGISGLSAALFALRKGHSVGLFDQDDRLGGLAATFDFKGIALEKFYHFICGGDDSLIELAGKLGIGDKLVFRPTRTANFIEGKLHPFSTPVDLLKFSAIPFLSRLRFGLNAAVSKYSKNWEALDAVSAKDWLCRRIGDKAYQAIWNPLLRIKFGPFADTISAAWIWHRIHRVASSRKTLFSRERMGYFEGGSRTLIERLGQEIAALGGEIRLESEVSAIRQEEGSFVIDLRPADRIECDKIILAVPLPVSARLLAPLLPDYSRRLTEIPYLAVVCGIFRLRKKVTDAFWLNINDGNIASSGFIEYTNLNPLPEIFPDRIVYVPFYLPVEAGYFRMDEASLETEFFKMLGRVNPGLSPADIVSFRTFRFPYAQAVCTTGFMKKRPPLATPLEGVFLLDSSQLYPADRNLSSLIGNAEKLVRDYF